MPRSLGGPLGRHRRALLRALERPVPGGGLDIDPPLGLLAPSRASGGSAIPGLEGHRGWWTRFRAAVHLDVPARRAKIAWSSFLSDAAAALSLRIAVMLAPSGVVTFAIRSPTMATRTIRSNAVRISLPVPSQAQELLTVGGRWTNEFGQARTSWTRELPHRREPTAAGHRTSGSVSCSRARPPSPSTAERSGDVTSGGAATSRSLCDAVTDARRSIQVGELLASGEIVLGPGGRYEMPTVYAAYSDRGLKRCRTLSRLPPRPAAAPFDAAVPCCSTSGRRCTSITTSKASAGLRDIAASCGVERFVVDDGWFHGAATITPVWATGGSTPTCGRRSQPLIEHVRGLGMQFGIWVEPEMVNPDSELYRAHPEWTLVDDRYPPCSDETSSSSTSVAREVRDYLFGHLDTLLRDHEIAYVKWDMNRDLVAGDFGRTGRRAPTNARRVRPVRSATSGAPWSGDRDMRLRRRASRFRDLRAHRAARGRVTRSTRFDRRRSSVASRCCSLRS